ncbi:hypothetical protein [Streptomyces sp. NPDC050504]|uniref:hypothetical protein n=1 Tax=Streptomyces sp. NPDC050504 TaxID=3365618 RepID=UPI00378FE847
MSEQFSIGQLGWQENARTGAGNSSCAAYFPGPRPAALVFHGEREFSYGHYGIHLGQADVLTFMGPAQQRITGTFIDCRAGSPTAGTLERREFTPSVRRALRIPPGVAHTFEGLEHVHTLNTYELYLPEPEEWVHGELQWRPDADIINVPFGVKRDELPYFTPNPHPAGALWYEIVAARQREMIPRLAHAYPLTRELRFDDGDVRRIEFRRRLDRVQAAGGDGWQPVEGIDGVGWGSHPVVRSGPHSGLSALLDPEPMYVADHSANAPEHRAHRVHLGQEDRLTFLGPSHHRVTAHLLDTRPDSPTYGIETTHVFGPDPERYLLLPPGVGHFFEHPEPVHTVNRPHVLSRTPDAPHVSFERAFESIQ